MTPHIAFLRPLSVILKMLNCLFHRTRKILTVVSVVLVAVPSANAGEGTPPSSCDRLWAVCTRHLTAEACRANLDAPKLSVARLSLNGRSSQSSLDQYFATVGSDRPAVVYVHGNRMDRTDAIRRALAIYRKTRAYRGEGPVDWVIWSWPSAKEGLLIRDFRRKAQRTDAQSLYLSWVLRRHAESNVPTTLIGYSFGGRVITGALHALAGGVLGGRTLPGQPVRGVPFDAGLVAPALDSHWLASRGKHGLATQNLDRMLLLYNRRDAVLKRYWLLDQVRGRMALGYSGPRSFAPRADGSELSLISRDCSPSVGIRHSEIDYYEKRCRAGSKMAALIDDVFITH